MSGRALVIALLLFTAVFGGALWYFQTRAYYREVVLAPPADPQVSAVQPADPDAGDAVPNASTATDPGRNPARPDPAQPVEAARAPDADTASVPLPERSAPVTGVRLRMVRLSDKLPEDILATDFTGIDADTSPIKFRACFRVENSVAYLTETYVIADEATPLQAPGWFDCFDAKTLTEDLDSGAAVAFLGERDIRYGVDRMVAVYGDGRGYAWNQFNRCGRAVYSGEELPEGCPPPPNGGQ